MRELSTSPHYQKVDRKDNYRPTTADSSAKIHAIAKKDWSPWLYFNTHVGIDNWYGADFLCFDVDNTIGDRCSIEEFCVLFAGTAFYALTSRNHQKEKQLPKTQGGGMAPPADRYHVLFPLSERIEDGVFLDAQLAAFSKKYPFFDKNALGRSRFYYGFEGVEIVAAEGACVALLDVSERMGPQVSAGNIEALLGLNSASDHAADQFKAEIDRPLLLAGLRLSAKAGKLDDRADWIKIGAAMYAEGFSFEDWMSISHDGETDVPKNQKIWFGFGSGQRAGAGSLVLWARLADPTFMTAGFAPTPALQQEKAAIIMGAYAPSTDRVIKLRAPCHLEDAPSPEKIQRIKQAITYIDEDGKTRYAPNWYTLLVELDPEIANCTYYDFTTGITTQAYDNERQLDQALYSRLTYYVPIGVASVDKSRDRLLATVEHRNRNYNSVASFIDTLIDIHPEPPTDILDQFLSVIKFGRPPMTECTQEQADRLYRELWDNFFLKMHLHVDGTRRDFDKKSYFGGMEKYPVMQDIVPILVGSQRQGKTSFCQWLGCAHLTKSMYVELGSGAKGDRFGDHDMVRTVQGKLIGEIGEMKVFKRADAVETIKSFVTKLYYNVDVKYVQRTRDTPATVSLLGTANMDEHLSDTTGNGRFFPVWVRGFDFGKMNGNIDIIEKLHSFYAQKAKAFPIDASRARAGSPSPELDNFITLSRDLAMIRNVDYDLCIELVAEDFQRARSERSGKQNQHNVTWNYITRLAENKNRRTRITKDSFTQVMQKFEYTQKNVKINGTTYRGYCRSLDDNLPDCDPMTDFDVNVDG